MLNKSDCNNWINDYILKDGTIIKSTNTRDFKEWNNVVEIIDYPAELLDIDSRGKVFLKSKEDIKYLQLKQKAQAILNDAKIKAVMEAINFQINTISKGADINNAIFTDGQIANWGDYIALIVKLDETTIDGNIPELPKEFLNLM